MRSVNTSIRIPVDLHEQIAELARANNVGVRAVIMEACRVYIRNARVASIRAVPATPDTPEHVVKQGQEILDFIFSR